MSDAPAQKTTGRIRLANMPPGFYALILLVIAVAAVTLRFTQLRFKHGTVTIADSLTLQVEVADTAATRERGLSKHKKLDADAGMYFLFDAPAHYTFWMKGMRFPIDIVWIESGRIVDITADVPVPVAGEPLPTYAPAVAASEVLEVQAGFARKHGLQVGMPVSMELAQ